MPPGRGSRPSITSLRRTGTWRGTGMLLSLRRNGRPKGENCILVQFARQRERSIEFQRQFPAHSSGHERGGAHCDKPTWTYGKVFTDLPPVEQAEFGGIQSAARTFTRRSSMVM